MQHRVHTFVQDSANAQVVRYRLTGSTAGTVSNSAGVLKRDVCNLPLVCSPSGAYVASCQGRVLSVWDAARGPGQAVDFHHTRPFTVRRLLHSLRLLCRLCGALQMTIHVALPCCDMRAIL